MRLAILTALLLSGCATVPDQTRTEIMVDIAQQYGVAAIAPPVVSVSPKHMTHPTAMCEAKRHQIVGTWVVCRKEPPAHVYYHEAVHVYQNHYSLPYPLGTGCERPKEFDAYILTANWCQRVGGCPAMITNPTDEFLKEKMECQ